MTIENRANQENIWSVLITGISDPYLVQDKLKEQGKFASLDAIKTAIKTYEQRESEKFGSTRTIRQGFALISKMASGGNKEVEDYIYHLLHYSFDHQLTKIAIKNDGEINLELKKEAASKAIDSVLPKKADIDWAPVLAGAGAFGIPAFIYNLLKGDEHFLSFLPYSALGGVLGGTYQALPEDWKFLG